MARLDSSTRSQFELQRRMRLARYLGIAAFLLLFLRLWNLQVLEGNRYETLAKSNRLRLHLEEGCRGLILDRNVEVLAKNRPSFDVFVTPREISDPKTISLLLANLLKADPAELARQIEEGTQRPQEAILVKKDVDDAAMVALQERKHDLGGVTLRVRPLRFYPNRDFSTHLLGYVSEINTAQLADRKSVV